MRISVTHLRGRLNEVLRALERSEAVFIVSRGEVKGVITPVQGRPEVKVQDHPFFGMLESSERVEQQMDRLRGSRYCSS